MNEEKEFKMKTNCIRKFLIFCFLLIFFVQQPVFAAENISVTEENQTENVTTTSQETTEKEPSSNPSKRTETKNNNKTKKKKQKDKSKKVKNEKDKKKEDKERKIEAPEETIRKAPVLAPKVKKQLQKELKGLQDEKSSLIHAQEIHRTITELYRKLEIISAQEALPVEVLLTGVKKENTTAADYNVNQELSSIAVLEKGALDTYLKNYTFGPQGGMSVINAMKEDQVVQLKPYLDQQLKETGQSSEKRKKKLEELDRKIKETKKEIKDLKADQDRVFCPTDLLTPSNLSVPEIQIMLKGTALEELAPAFYQCERKYGVNAVAIMGIAIHESAWGTSRRAREDHNLTGYGVTSDSAKGINANTKEENLLMTAKLLKEKYLIPGSAYYWKAPSLIGVNYHYCVGDEWAAAVTNYGYQLMEKLK